MSAKRGDSNLVTDMKEKALVLSIVHKFLGGIKDRDPASMHSFILPTSTAHIIRPSPNSPETQLIQIPISSIINTRIPFDSPESSEENIAKAEFEEGQEEDGEKYEGRKTKVEVDHDLAVVWTPYEVRLGGAVHHVGTNIFSLAKVQGKWLIMNISDTSRLPKESLE